MASFQNLFSNGKTRDSSIDSDRYFIACQSPTLCFDIKTSETGETRICVLMMGINFHWQRRPLCRRFSGAHSTSIIIVSLHVFPTGDQYITINLLYSLDW